MSTLVSTLILFAGDLVRHKTRLRNSCTCWSRCSMEALANCRFQTLMKVSKGVLRISWKSWRMASARLMHVSALILFARDLGRPRSHLRNSCNYCSRCIMESLANFRLQALVGDSKGALGRSWQYWTVVPVRLTVVSVLIIFTGALVLPQSHLRVDCTCRSICKAWGSDVCKVDACR